MFLSETNEVPVVKNHKINLESVRLHLSTYVI